ncbi:MAG: hypothetical protein WKG03_04045 [Telluria sp.]
MRGPKNAIFSYFEDLLPMRTTQLSHFYLGPVTDSSRFSRLLAEHYSEDDDQPISEFYGSQGEFFCDHVSWKLASGNQAIRWKSSLRHIPMLTNGRQRCAQQLAPQTLMTQIS